MKPDLSVEIAGLKLKNPVMTASGTFGYGLEYEPFFDIGQLGAIAVKGISLKPRPGNAPPRVIETPAGMLNAIGLQNVGVEAFINEKLPLLNKKGVTVIVNFFGNTDEEYVQLAEKLNGTEGIAALEMNISCPNVKEGGIVFGTDPKVAHDLTKKIKKVTTLPLIVKLSPNVTSIGEMAKSVEDAGADALSMINTITGMSIDIRKRKSKLANMTGGLSGPAIKPVAVRMVWEAAKAVKIPIIGIGGIMSAEDAIEFIIAGASAIQIGTANFINPSIALEIIKGIETFMLEEKIEKISHIIGSLSQ
ncbi:MAG: dihydroorotate dehydrogenase [Proteobacteria bacterium]|nr:dihydroorotate dehydrogenase [Pseudomonadota bacterium]